MEKLHGGGWVQGEDVDGRRRRKGGRTTVDEDDVFSGL